MFEGLFRNWKQDPLGAGKPLPREEIERLTVARFGRRPELDPGNPRDSQTVADLNLSGTIVEHEESVRRAEDELARHPNPIWLTICRTALFIVEVLGAIGVFKAMGFENPLRNILGVALAAGVFYLTNWARTANRRLSMYVAFGGYALLILALTVIRLGEVGSGDDGSAMQDIANAIILIFATIMPALMFERIAPTWDRVAQALRELHQARARLRRTRRQQSKAQKSERRRGTHLAEYDDKVALFQSRFRTEP